MVAGALCREGRVPLQRSGVLFFAPATTTDGRSVRGEKPSKQEGIRPLSRT
jgi:hypothetical protein